MEYRNCKAGLGIRSFALRSFAQNRSLKRVTVSDLHSLTSIFTKERCDWFACDSNESSAKNERFARKIHIFCMCLIVFPSFLYPRANHSRHSSLSRSFFKEWLEHFAPIALHKRVMRAIHSFSRANHSFALLLNKKTSESLEKWGANSRPCCKARPASPVSPAQIFLKKPFP